MTPVAIQSILGLVQGVTEWFPISSTGHLALAERFLGLTEDLSYDVFLHIASLAVMLVFFRREIASLFMRSVIRPQREARREVGYLAVTTILTLGIGFALTPVEGFLRTPTWIAAGLAVNAAVLFMVRGLNGPRSIDLRSAVVIGLVQGLAVVPSISRSALTISLALLMKMKRDEAFRYSFLAAIPAIAGAIVLTVPKLHWDPVYLVGFAITAVVSYLALVLLRIIVRRDYLHWFWVYNVILAVLVLIYA